MRAALFVVLVTLATSFSGCAGLNDLFGSLNRPDVRVQRTGWDSGQWTNEALFGVVVDNPAPHNVRIKAVRTDGTVVVGNGSSMAGAPAVQVDLPDGVWTVTYHIDGYKWETLKGVKLDTVAPAIIGLPVVAEAPNGSLRLGDAAYIESGAAVNVIEQSTGVVLASALPFDLVGLAQGIHAYDVVARDSAGNIAIVTVQVRVGDAFFLPPGQHTLGIVARYPQELGLWDLTDLDAYLSREQAKSAVQAAYPSEPEAYLGAGNGIAPNDPGVLAAVAQSVRSSDNSLEAALGLFRWLADHTEYDQDRRDSEAHDLQSPADTLARGEGVCRDLAALYVSLLRAAGVPARLVAGYVGSANVGGFHAWVEFYAGGNGPSPWVPVDVSFDGDGTPATVVQFFAIRPIGNLPLRAVTERQEDGEWYLASQVSYRAARAPTVDFADTTKVSYETIRSLCFDPATLERQIGPLRDKGCQGMPAYFPGIKAAAETVLDYGVDITASGTTEVTVSLAFPARELEIQRQSYGAQFRFDETTGAATATWNG